MKNLFKFTAVVAACTFASCSDNLSEFSNQEQPTAANELKIVAEEMGGRSLTRTAYVSESSNDRVWQETDKFQVFGSEIVGKYDYYMYKKSSNKFELDGTKDLDEAAYVAFPADAIEGQKWDKDTGSGFLTYKINKELSYDEVSGSSPVAYVSNLPLWGTAENDGDGIKADVYFLTSIIKVYLTNALNNAKAVRIQAFNDIEGTEPAMIAGEAKVKVSENNQALSPDQVQLANPTDGKNTIIVNLGDLSTKAANSVVYIPLIAGHYGRVKVEWSPDYEAGHFDTMGDYIWNNVREDGDYLDKDFKRGTPYGKGNTQEFEVNANTISGVNKMLANMATSASGEVEVGVQTPITDIDASLNVPAMANVTKLTLNIPEFNDNSVPNSLVVEGDFAGTLVLNPTATTNLGTTVEIRTKNANVIMGGAWSNKAFKFTYAKTVQFGGLLNENEEPIVANYSVNVITLGAAVEGVIVGEGATVGALTLDTDHKAKTLDVLGTSGTITVNASSLENATAVNVAGTAGAITINGDNNEATVEISGKATSISNNGKGAITISGNPVYQATGAAKVGAVTTKGNVTINLANEGVAINGPAVTDILTFNAPATLTLTQGYVKGITVNPGDKKTVTCTLGNGYVTLPTPTITSGEFTVSNVPTWNGEIIGGSFDTPDEVTAIKAVVGEANYVEPTDWANFKDAATAVYTPIGLAMNRTTFTLANDINLDNKDWTPVACGGNVDGNGKTISNLNVPAQKDKDATPANAGRGLFKNIGSYEVKNLTLDGVTINAAPYKVGGAATATVPSNIGALAGGIHGATIKYVSVKNLTVTATGGVNNIGGIAGQAYSTASILSGVQLTGTNKINGYYNLGGLIGYAGIGVTIQKLAKGAIDATPGKEVPAADVASAATVSFKANYNNTDITNDLKYLQVGNFIGSAKNTAAIVINDAADVKPTLTYDKSIYTGTTKYQVTTSGTTRSYDIVFDKQTLIGWCGDTYFDNDPFINTKAYPVYLTKPDLDAIPVNSQYWLYYIDME